VVTDPVVLIRPGVVLEREGKRYCVRRLLSTTEFDVIDVESGGVEKRSLHDFNGSLALAAPSPRVDLAALNEDDWVRAIDRFRQISPLVGRPQRTRADVREIAVRASINVATLYRWLARFESSGTVSSLLRHARNDQGRSRVGDRAEQIMKDVIRDYFLKDQAISVTRAYREVERQCKKEGVETPALSTIRRRIAELTPAELATSREGKKAARRFRPLVGEFPGANFPYAVLQIDHTRVDIVLVDEAHRLPVERPYITVAIDVFSRMVAGYYISFDPPGTLGTAMCIANAILPKARRLAELGVSYSWPCRGLPAVIHVDNAKEFRGNALKNACAEYGIDLQFRMVQKPDQGGHIERMMGTLMKEIHALPGTTRSRSHELGEYDPEARAAMTLREFESWFANLVLGAYHHRVHGELKLPPIVKYERGILGDSTQPGVGYPPIPQDEDKLRIDFLPFEMRTIQPYGIAVDGIYYQADVLHRWIGATETSSVRVKRKFVIRRDPRDISYVLFYDPDAKRHFRIPYQNPRFPAISLWELRAIQRYLKEQGKKAENQDVIFAAFDEMQRIEEQAVAETKRVRIAKVRRQARQRSLKGLPLVDKGPTEPRMPAEPEKDEIDILPFDDVEDL
jgi:putative transposase